MELGTPAFGGESIVREHRILDKLSAEVPKDESENCQENRRLSPSRNDVKLALLG